MTYSITSFRWWLAAIAIAVGMFLGWGLSNTSHEDAANASWAACGHPQANLHELSGPPSSWPGTRAAHIVTRFSTFNVQSFYTKSGWWDPTWDFYTEKSYLNC